MSLVVNPVVAPPLTGTYPRDRNQTALWPTRRAPQRALARAGGQRHGDVARGFTAPETPRGRCVLRGFLFGPGKNGRGRKV